MIVSNNEEELIERLNSIFNTKKFKETVGGLMKIARTKRDQN